MTTRKRKFADQGKSASNTPTDKVEDDLSTRCSNAENLLKERPTGFALPQAADKSDEASETLVSPIAEEGRAPDETTKPTPLATPPVRSNPKTAIIPGIGIPRYEEVPLELIDDNQSKMGRATWRERGCQEV